MGQSSSVEYLRGGNAPDNVLIDILEQTTTDNSAFGEKTSVPFYPLTGWAFTYNLNPGVIVQETIDTGVITNVEGHAVLNSGSGATGLAKIETVRSSRYIPGVGGTVRFTAIFSEPQPNSKQVIGLINGTDGWAFGYNGTEFGILRKRDLIEDWIPQTSWNVDKKPNFDPTKGNVFQIKYQWLGYGMQYFYMENEEGVLSLVHRIPYNNTKTETSILNPNLPLSAYVVNVGNTTPIELQTPSAIAGLNGDGFNDAISTNVAQDGTDTVTGTDVPILSFRLSDTYKGKANRLFAQVLRAVFACEGNQPVRFRAYAGGTLVGGAWDYISEEVSPMEYNNTATSYTPGLFIGSFPVARNSTLEVAFGVTNFRIYAGQQIVIAVTTSAPSEVVCGVNWKSFV
jgi:hypothetical protein